MNQTSFPVSKKEKMKLQEKEARLPIDQRTIFIEFQKPTTTTGLKRLFMSNANKKKKDNKIKTELASQFEKHIKEKNLIMGIMLAHTETEGKVSIDTIKQMFKNRQNTQNVSHKQPLSLSISDKNLNRNIQTLLANHGKDSIDYDKIFRKVNEEIMNDKMNGLIQHTVRAATKPGKTVSTIIKTDEKSYLEKTKNMLMKQLLSNKPVWEQELLTITNMLGIPEYDKEKEKEKEKDSQNTHVNYLITQIDFKILDSYKNKEPVTPFYKTLLQRVEAEVKTQELQKKNIGRMGAVKGVSSASLGLSGLSETNTTIGTRVQYEPSNVSNDAEMYFMQNIKEPSVVSSPPVLGASKNTILRGNMGTGTLGSGPLKFSRGNPGMLSVIGQSMLQLGKQNVDAVS